MVEVRLADPGSELPEPTSRDAHRFHESTLRAFSRRLDSLAWQENRRLFLATEEDRVVAVGLTRNHQVRSLQGDRVRLSDSHAVHRVSPEVEALSPGDWYEMAVDPRTNSILKATPKAASEEAVPRPLESFRIDPKSLPEVSEDAANAFFASVRRQPHIPFQYAADGCMARAQEMCRLIEGYFDLNPGEVLAKIWNFGDLIAKTDNHPDCQVPWFYHVAPVVNLGAERLLVIDPALFDTPVSIAKWQARQTDPSTDLLFTSQNAYDFVKGDLFVEESPDLASQTLQFCWAALISQVYTNGPLPYRCGEPIPVVPA